MALLLVLLFVAVPIAELYVIIQVGQAIGAGWTILILIVDSIVGARLLSWQGRSAWRRFQEAVAAARVPHHEVLDGVLIVFGGALLLTPGFITDALGLALLIPPSRALVRRAIAGTLRRRTTVARVVYQGRPRRSPGPPEPPEPPARQPPERRLPSG